jgi:hypothetical protein
MSDQQNTLKSATSPFRNFCNHAQFASVEMDSSAVNYRGTFCSGESRVRDDINVHLLGEAIPLVAMSITDSGSQLNCVEISE